MRLWRKVLKAARAAHERAACIALTILAGYEYRQGRYGEALLLASRACELAGRQYGEGHRRFGIRLHHLGLIYREMGEYGAAEHCLTRASEIVRLAGGGRQQDLPVSLKELASLYSELGHYERAEPLYREALDLWQSAAGRDGGQVARVLISMGGMYYDMKDLESAERCYRQALEECARVYRRYSEEGVAARADAHNGLGMVLSERGDMAEAEASYREALRMKRVARGKRHPSTTAPMLNLALLCRTMGRYDEAEALARGVWLIRRDAHGESHPSFASALNILAGLREDRGDYRGAEGFFVAALDLTRRAFGDRHPKVSQPLNNLGLLYYLMGRYEEAEKLLLESLEILRLKWGDKHPSLNATLNNLALLYCRMARYRESEDFFLRSREIIRSSVGEAHPDFALNLANLAQLYTFMGEYDSARPLYRRACDIRRELFGESHPDLVIPLSNLAQLERVSGDYPSAEALYLEALEIARAALGEANPTYAVVLNNLGQLYLVTGRYEDARRCFRRALEIRRGALGEDHPDVINVRSSLAFLYRLMGDYARAEAHWKGCAEALLRTYGEAHPEYAVVIHNLATLYADLDRNEEAAELCTKALDIRLAALGPAHPACAESLNTLGMILDSVGRYDEAEEQYKTALEILTEALGEDHPDTGLSLNNLANLYLSTGRHDEAGALLETALQRQTRALGPEHPQVALLSTNLALARAAAGRHAAALSLLDAVSRSEDVLIGRVFSLGTESQRLGSLGGPLATRDVLLALVLRHFARGATEVRLALEVVLKRKGLGAEALAAQRDAVTRGRYPHLAAPLHELMALRMRIGEYGLAALKSEAGQGLGELLAEAERRKEELEAQLAEEIPEIRLQREMQDVSVDRIASALPEHSALIEFVRVDDFDFDAVPARGEERIKPPRYVAFVLPAGEPERAALVDLGDAGRVEHLVAKFEASLTREAALRAASGELPPGESGDTEASLDRSVASLFESVSLNIGGTLRRRLFDPLLPFVGDNCRLFLAPEGNLTMLPFETLPAASGGHLIDSYHFSYLSAGRDLLRFAGETTPAAPRLRGAPLVIGNPNFDLCADEPAAPSARAAADTQSFITFTPLASTEGECEYVAERLGVVPLLRDAVLEDEIKSQRSPAVFHIATHGFFLADKPKRPVAHAFGVESLRPAGPAGLEQLLSRPSENPLLRSGLALAGANTWARGGSLPENAGDGIMTAADVSGLDLTNTELVVLSACHTGLGAPYVGEGVFGLRRAFELAGAKTIIMSLWRVPGVETQALMELFYDGITQGMPRGEALRAAQLALKNKGLRNPFFWGAFICQGDTRKLPPDFLSELPSPRSEIDSNRPL